MMSKKYFKIRRFSENKVVTDEATFTQNVVNIRSTHDLTENNPQATRNGNFK